MSQIQSDLLNKIINDIPRFHSTSLNGHGNDCFIFEPFHLTDD